MICVVTFGRRDGIAVGAQLLERRMGRTERCRLPVLALVVMCPPMRQRRYGRGKPGRQRDDKSNEPGEGRVTHGDEVNPICVGEE
jgi:hypothetical protein